MHWMAFVMLLVAATPVFADPCASDIEFLCKDKAGAALEDCMDAASYQVSADCRAVRQEKKAAALAETMATCAADAEKFCVAREKNETVMRCLLRSNVSDACADKLREQFRIRPAEFR